MKHKYRVVRDNWCGYEAQVKFWWCPFIWFQLDGSGHSIFGANTRYTVEQARDIIERHKENKSKVVYQE